MLVDIYVMFTDVLMGTWDSHGWIPLFRHELLVVVATTELLWGKKPKNKRGFRIPKMGRNLK
jgi:hypothetical protein